MFHTLPHKVVHHHAPVSFHVATDQVAVGREAARYNSLDTNWPWRIEDGEDNIDAPSYVPIGGCWRGGSGNVYLEVTYRE